VLLAFIGSCTQCQAFIQHAQKLCSVLDHQSCGGFLCRRQFALLLQGQACLYGLRLLTTDVDGLQGRTPLHHAAFTNDLESIKLMLHHGANATATDYQVHYTTQTDLSTA